MSFILNNKKLSALLLVILLGLFYIATNEKITDKNFVGKWQSSKLATPIYLYENNEWEIKKDDGTVLQYGVWQYKDKRLIWSYKMGYDIGHDVDPILKVEKDTFKVLEADRSITTFTRLNE